MSTVFAEGHQGGYGANGKVFTESDWSNTNNDIPVYDRSKTLAERAAWDFIGDRANFQGGRHAYELAVINPGFIMGPMLHDVEGTSATVSNRWFTARMV